MKYRTLGRTNLEISEIGFGAWAIGESMWGTQDDNESLKALHKAIDNGVNFIDTAAGYGDGGSERLIAKILKERKEELIVATKTPPDAGPWPPSPYCNMDERYSEKYVRQNVEQRLRNLNTECLDILQLHTWTRAWNHDPRPFDILKKLQQEGKIKHIGISTPEPDQNAVNDLMRQGYLDTVQVIYNLFEQEPAAELLPLAQKHNVGIIVRVVFDEGILTGKYNRGHKFPDGDFRNKYFKGDRLEDTLNRLDNIKADLEGSDYTLPEAAVKFALQHPAVSTVITGVRNVHQAEMNTAMSDLADIPEALMNKLRKHYWYRAFWYQG